MTGARPISELKLGKLPDRTPVKITIALDPDLNQSLRDYATIYRAKYGEAESVAELIPFMLSAFLESDKGIAKARKELPLEAPSEVAGQRNQNRSSQSRSTPSQETYDPVCNRHICAPEGWRLDRRHPDSDDQHEGAAGSKRQSRQRQRTGIPRVRRTVAHRRGLGGALQRQDAKDYLRVRLDDPSWAGPISAALFQSEDGNEAELVWSRRKVEASGKVD